MHKFSLVTKPPEASGIFNGLLAAVIAGRSYGETNAALSFEDHAINVFPDSAPRGYNNSNYSVVPHASAIDPTSVLAVSQATAFRRNPIGTVGYTHDHVAVEMLTHISSMYARFHADYMVLYAKASAAQKATRAGEHLKIDSVREVRYTDGDVADYLACVGSLADGNISYPATQTIDVDIIHARVMRALSSNIGILDNLGFSVGERAAARTIGTSTLPKSGVNVALTTPSTFDNIISHRWKRLLTLPRGRELLKEVFMERLRSLENPGVVFDPSNAKHYALVEGGDTLYIPTHINGLPVTWDSLVAEIDNRPTLSTAMYQSDGAGNYSASWLHQFYTLGDLTTGLLNGTIDPLADDCLLSVLLSNPKLDTSTGAPLSPNGNVIMSKVTGSTGCLSSYNVIVRSAVSPITGSINVINGINSGTDGVGGPGDMFAYGNTIIPGSTDIMLPNGLLTIGSCGDATATNWINILRYLDLNYPQRVKSLMAASGRSKKTFAASTNSIGAMDQLLASALSAGQRDGYLNVPTLAFNSTRLVRDEQDGPLFAGSTYSVANPGMINVTPYVSSQINQWDRTDVSSGRYVVDMNGTVLNFNSGSPSRFTGEWDAGRLSGWAPAFAADTIAVGTPNIEQRIGTNLLSLPCAISSTGILSPRYSPVIGGDSFLPTAIRKAFQHPAANSAHGSTGSMEGVCEYISMNAGTIDGYRRALALESYHPTRGFMRGLALFLPDDTYYGGSGDEPHSPGTASGAWSRGRLTGTESVMGTIVPLNGSSPKVFSSELAASLPYAAAETAPGEENAAPGNNWVWDPSRAQILGGSWHRWCGIMFDDILPHPYLPHPVAVPTSVVRMTDLVGRELPSEQSCSAQLFGGATTGWNDLTGSATVVSSNPSVMADGISGVCSSLAATNPASSWTASVSSALSRDADRLDPLVWNALSANADTVEQIPSWEFLIGIRNGHQGHSLGASTAYGLLRNTDDTSGSPLLRSASGNLGGDNTLNKQVPMVLEGENLFYGTPTNIGVGARPFSRPAMTLQISGKGLLFEGDTFTANVLSPMAWYNFVYTGDTPILNGALPNFWAPYQAGGLGFTSVAEPGVGANFTGSASPAQTVDALSTLKYEITGNGVNGVGNDWFRKDLTLSSKHARMRPMLPNPWIRPAGGPGFAHLRYDNSQIGGVYDSVLDSVLALGRSLQVGLTNSDFLTIQIAN